MGTVEVVEVAAGSRTGEAEACHLANGDEAKPRQSAKEAAKAGTDAAEVVGEEVEGEDAGGGRSALLLRHPQSQVCPRSLAYSSF
jgi:hypothetical protein